MVKLVPSVDCGDSITHAERQSAQGRNVWECERRMKK